MTTPSNQSKGNTTADQEQLSPNPDVVNDFHRYADTDTAPEALHHTTGKDPNQASPGDHNHDGRNSVALTTNNLPASQTPRAIQGQDSRAVNDTPNQEQTVLNNRTGPAESGFMVMTGPEFKQGSTIGLPSAYYGVVTVAPWGDDSGGGIHQTAYGSGGVDDVYKRYGVRSGSWGAWKRVSGMSILSAINNTSVSFANTSYSALAFVAPSNGIVKFNLSTTSSSASTFSVSTDGGTTFYSFAVVSCVGFIYLTGLTPGTTYTPIVRNNSGTFTCSMGIEG